MRQIAAAVGLRQSSLYNHFAGKEDIYHALVDAHGPASSADRLAAPRYRALKGDPAAFCRLYAADLLDQWCDVREQRFVNLITAERNRMTAEREHYFDALFSREARLATDYFRGFVQGGRIAALDPTETARLFMAGLTVLRRQHFIRPVAPSPRETVHAALERFVDHFLALIAPRELITPRDMAPGAISETSEGRS